MRNYVGLIDSLMAYVQNCVAANRCDDKVRGPRRPAEPRAHPHRTPARTGRRADGGGRGTEVQSAHPAGGESRSQGLAGHRYPWVPHALSLERTLPPAPLSAVTTGLRRAVSRAPGRGGGHSVKVKVTGRGRGHEDRLRVLWERKEGREEDLIEEGSI